MSQQGTRPPLNSERWTTIREFVDREGEYTLPKYEAKLIEDADREFIEPNLVLVKKTSSTNGAERIFHLPRNVLVDIAEHVD